ncbi:MAG: glutamate racemase, partial [Deltaproteobacteria bacterium]|nr:glutamate racemase [Deltaproteobacteria bacterium]
MRRTAIGIFDSGVGGLSVLREVRRLLPGERVLYFADQANVPYGHRPLKQVRRFSEEISRFLVARGAKVVVVACNTASGAALYHLREVFPAIPFVGLEPAVKPAAQRSRTKTIGVIATPGTFQGELFHRVVERFAGDVRVLAEACPGLVEQIEAGAVDSPVTRSLLERCLAPLLAEGIDSLVLGCTHYPFARAVMGSIAGPHVWG